MSKKSKNDSTKPSQPKRILSDHIKSGKRLIPPMLQIGNVKGISLSQLIIPEFIWMAILNDQFGWQEGARLSLSLARAAAVATGLDLTEFEKADGRPPRELFATTSAFSTLTVDECRRVNDQLQICSERDSLVRALELFLLSYPYCPLRFLLKEGHASSDTEHDLQSLKTVILPLFDKYSREAVAMFANALYIAFCTNKLKVFKGSLLSSFPDIQNYPDTEQSRAIASSIRASVYSLLRDTPTEWASYFWNNGLEIDPCDYEGVVTNANR